LSGDDGNLPEVPLLNQLYYHAILVETTVCKEGGRSFFENIEDEELLRCFVSRLFSQGSQGLMDALRDESALSKNFDRVLILLHQS
jgi:hypothetical protein